jgi:Alpha/beta hydrolase of unknown function (DUF900)
MGLAAVLVYTIAGGGGISGTELYNGTPDHPVAHLVGVDATIDQIATSGDRLRRSARIRPQLRPNPSRARAWRYLPALVTESFNDAVNAAGSICRLLGRDFVCVVLTWPAGGSRGAFLGYNIDRESGEFAVAEMRKAIRAIGETEGVRGVDIVAHSRGTDVLASALGGCLTARCGRSEID